MLAVIFYRAILSPYFGGRCRFYPSCSEYCEQSLKTHGAVKGARLSLIRISRCRPGGAYGADPVPLKLSLEIK